MTRRIVAAILLVVWTTLIAGGAAAYLAVQTLMLEELDSTIIQRAAAIYQVAGGPISAGTFYEHPRDRYIIVDERGQTVARMPIDAAALPSPQTLDRSFTTLGDGQRMRTLTLQIAKVSNHTSSPSQVKVVYSIPADVFDRTLSRLAWTLLIGGTAAGMFAAMIAGTVARRALKPLREATAVISTIDLRNLDRRVAAEPLPVELRPVAATLNEMLSTLQEAVAQRRQFLADASHELRTPIAALLTAMEVSLSRPRSEGELRQTLQRCLGNVNALRQIVEHLLDQVRSERFTDEEIPKEICVADCVERVIGQLAPLAENRNIRVEHSCEKPLAVTTQPRRFESIVFNLVSNAIEHNRAGGSVRVTAEVIDGDLVVTVTDNGPGIPSELHGHIFEPFYRIDSSRDIDGGHLGLGLFLVQSHLRALKGRHEIRSAPDEGTAMRITFPHCVLSHHGYSRQHSSSLPAVKG